MDITEKPNDARPTVYEQTTDRDHFIAPPPRRLGALGLMLNEAGQVLMCEREPSHDIPKPMYHLGGAAEKNEDPRAACARVTRAKIGIDITPGRLLVVHHMFDQEHTNPQTGQSHVSQEGINFIFDCGTLPADTEFTLGAGVTATRWIRRQELEEHLSPFTAARTRAALRALEGGEVELLTGHPQ